MKENNYFSLNDIISEAILNETNNIFIFSHTRHDGDAKGSALALVEYFKNKGFNSKYVITDDDRCFINILGSVEKTEALEESDFIAVSVDTATKDDCDNTLYENAIALYRIDHHKNAELFGDYNYVVEGASSTCEIISSMIDENDMTSVIATYLYLGIYTDTGGFKYTVNENTYTQLSKLLRCGADNKNINTSLKYTSSVRKRVEGFLAYNHKFYGQDIVGATFKKDKHSVFDAKSVARAVNTLTNMRAKIFFCCCEDDDGKVFVEIRSSQNSDIDVSKLAKEYGISGHFHTASFMLNSFDEVDTLISKIRGLH